jgi:hypothetical protein
VVLCTLLANHMRHPVVSVSWMWPFTMVPLFVQGFQQQPAAVLPSAVERLHVRHCLPAACRCRCVTAVCMKAAPAGEPLSDDAARVCVVACVTCCWSAGECHTLKP